MDGSPASDFEKKAPPLPLMGPEAYFLLLEKMVKEGKTFGKSEPVAAYFLTDIKFDTTDDAGKKIGESVIEVKPTYVIMDLKVLTNEYARGLTLQDIAVQYAKRSIGIKDLNSPDFKGSYIWSAKQSAFEGDYKRREGLNEYAKAVNVWDPRPEAFRLTLQFNEAAIVPVEWGTYPALVGSTLTIRDKDIPQLLDALHSVKRGEKTAAEALYTQNDKGETVARFDIYVMDPGFRDANYKHVEFREETRKLLDSYAAEQAPAPKPAKNAGNTLQTP